MSIRERPQEVHLHLHGPSAQDEAAMAAAVILIAGAAQPGAAGVAGAACGVVGHAPSAGLLTRCCWLSAWLSPLPRRRRQCLTRAAPPRHFVAEHAPVIAAHPELDARCSG